ncbi:Flagellin [Aeromonas salmonicida]|nr:putative flagellin B [Aeromonas salmonicida subsp. masoucida NBRC 13784]
MDEVTSMLQRMRTLAQQSANGSNNTDDRTALQQEYDQLTTEIDRISSDTTFGGQKLLDGKYKGSFQVGADAGQTITFKMTSAFTISGIAAASKGSATVAATTAGSKEPYKVTSGTTPVTVANMNSIKAASSAQSAMANLDFMIKAVDSKRAELGAVQNRFDSTIRNQSNVSENLSAARSRIRDADFATETANLTKQNILQQAASSILAQANQRPQSALSLLG